VKPIKTITPNRAFHRPVFYPHARRPHVILGGSKFLHLVNLLESSFNISISSSRHKISLLLVEQNRSTMPPMPLPLSAMRTLSRFSRQASKFTPLSTRTPLPVQQLSSLRFAHSHYSTEASSPTASRTPVKSKPHAPPAPRRPPQPEYEMTFTCKPCSTRSTHRVSKQGYHYGSVLITCPECRNRHVISDHLNVNHEPDERKRAKANRSRFSEISI